MSDSPQKRSISISEPSNGPISPLTLAHPTENNSASRLGTITEHVAATHTTRSRAKSTPTLSFAEAKPKVASSLPSPNIGVTNLPKGSPVVRPRTTSPPPPARFQNRVAFDNVDHGDPTEHNIIAFTLNVKHEGYQFKRHSRTFMVGVDDNLYSNIALQWVLEEMIDDGDQIVCIRVIEKDAKIVSDRALEKKKYRDEAKALMDGLQKRNGEQRAINIILEYAVGKLEDTFLRMLEIYKPSMLIVGTRGRSLGGFQGLMAGRNSFSKWCLQFCTVPVVVVRPTEKRMKKKMKRDADPTRRDYVRILRESGINTHETEVFPNTRLFEASNSPNLEAHAVAAAIGLPADFDPTLTSTDLPESAPLKQVDSATSATSAVSVATSGSGSRSPSPVIARKKSPPPPDPVEDSGDESGEEGESSDEFEAVPGELLLDNAEEADKKKKLHDMEVGEAAALAGRKNSVASLESTASGKTATEEEEEKVQNEDVKDNGIEDNSGEETEKDDVQENDNENEKEETEKDGLVKEVEDEKGTVVEEMENTDLKDVVDDATKVEVVGD